MVVRLCGSLRFPFVLESAARCFQSPRRTHLLVGPGYDEPMPYIISVGSAVGVAVDRGGRLWKAWVRLEVGFNPCPVPGTVWVRMMPQMTLRDGSQQTTRRNPSCPSHPTLESGLGNPSRPSTMPSPVLYLLASAPPSSSFCFSSQYPTTKPPLFRFRSQLQHHLHRLSSLF